MSSEDSDSVGEPISELLASAIAVHEMYVTYQEAGFTSAEALYLVTSMVKGSTDGEVS